MPPACVSCQPLSARPRSVAGYADGDEVGVSDPDEIEPGRHFALTCAPPGPSRLTRTTTAARLSIAVLCARLVGLQKGRDLLIVRKVVCESSRSRGRLRQVVFAETHVPQPKFGLRVREEVGVHRRGIPNVGEGLLAVSAAEQPPCAPRHLGTHDVVDPGARDARSSVLRIVPQHGVERSSRLPVFVPAGFPSQQAELKPDVVQIHLAQKEQRRIIVWLGSERRARLILTAMDLREEFPNQVCARRALLQRLSSVAVVLDQGSELEEQRGSPQLVVRKIRGVRRTPNQCQRGGRFVVGVVEQALGVGKRRLVGWKCRH